MRAHVVLLMFALSVGIHAHGQHCPAPIQVAPAVEGHGVAKALVPAYGAAYSASDDLLKQILEEIKGLRKDVQGLRLGAAGSGNTLADAVGRHCVQCHAAQVADDKGGGFVLVEKSSTLADLSLAEKRRVARLVEQGKMPPAGQPVLTDDEKKVFQALKGESK